MSEVNANVNQFVKPVVCTGQPEQFVRINCSKASSKIGMMSRRKWAFYQSPRIYDRQRNYSLNWILAELMSRGSLETIGVMLIKITDQKTYASYWNSSETWEKKRKKKSWNVFSRSDSLLQTLNIVVVYIFKQYSQGNKSKFNKQIYSDKVWKINLTVTSQLLKVCLNI